MSNQSYPGFSTPKDTYARHHRQRRFATSLWLTGLFAAIMSFGGNWGTAYGQTAGPTPTPGAQPVLAITTEVDTTNPRPGQTVVMIIRVTNNGSAPARNVNVTDVIPPQFEIINVYGTSGIYGVNGQIVDGMIAEIAPGATVVITVEVVVRRDAQGRIINEVIVRMINQDGVVINTVRAEVAVTIQGASGASGSATENGGGTAAGNQSGVRSQLGNTGGQQILYWPLLLIGVLLMLAGTAIFLRARKAA